MSQESVTSYANPKSMVMSDYRVPNTKLSRGIFLYPAKPDSRSEYEFEHVFTAQIMFFSFDRGTEQRTMINRGKAVWSIFRPYFLKRRAKRRKWNSKWRVKAKRLAIGYGFKHCFSVRPIFKLAPNKSMTFNKCDTRLVSHRSDVIRFLLDRCAIFSLREDTDFWMSKYLNFNWKRPWMFLRSFISRWSIYDGSNFSSPIFFTIFYFLFNKVKIFRRRRLRLEREVVNGYIKRCNFRFSSDFRWVKTKFFRTWEYHFIPFFYQRMPIIRHKWLWSDIRDDFNGWYIRNRRRINIPFLRNSIPSKSDLHRRSMVPE